MKVGFENSDSEKERKIFMYALIVFLLLVVLATYITHSNVKLLDEAKTETTKRWSYGQ